MVKEVDKYSSTIEKKKNCYNYVWMYCFSLDWIILIKRIIDRDALTVFIGINMNEKKLISTKVQLKRKRIVTYGCTVSHWIGLF